MTRGWAGLLLIVGVLLAALVESGLRPRAVTGTPQAVPVPGPPTVGDCVTGPVHSALIDFDLAAATAISYTYPQQETAPCQGDRYGEVVAVIATPKVAAITGDGDQMSVSDPNMPPCVRAVDAYVGFSDLPAFRYWVPNFSVGAALSRPTPRQAATGQHWLACLVQLNPDPGPAQASLGEKYRHSLRSALINGDDRDQLGSCLPVLDWYSGAIVGSGCTRPHEMEVLAVGFTDTPITRGDLLATCRSEVRQLTRMPDPTAGGALSIQVHATVGDGTDDDIGAAIPAHASLQCAVIAPGNRLLAGSLLGLGSRPTPWA